MPVQITMPRLSDTMEEGTLVKWNVKVGDDVSAGDHLADVETDKATMELQAFEDGKVAKLAIEEGQTVPVGDLILVLAEEGESVEDAAKAQPESAKSASTGGEATEEEAPTKSASTGGESAQRASARDEKQESTAPAGSEAGSHRIKASPLARKLAEEHDVELSDIEGSGPDGRIVKRDVLAAAEKGAAKPGKSAQAAPGQAATPQAAPALAPASLEAKTYPLSNMRKTIARRLVESKTTIPHFQVSISVNMDPLLDLRKTLNTQLESQGVKLSVNDFITRAAALALVRHPIVNSSWDKDKIQQHGTVNMGVAVALPSPPEGNGGLVVPVLRDAQNMGLRTISQETRRLAKKARETGLATDEMTGGTFTLSNLGMYGVEHFTAIINPPEAAILAIGAALERPVVRGSELTIGHEMILTLSGDHRVIDGAIGAEYLQTLKQLLENPAALLV